MIADVKFFFDPANAATKQHFQTGFAPIAISWNENDVVTVELPTKGDDFPITDADRKFLTTSFARALHQSDFTTAATWLIRTKIGNHGMGLLRQTVNQETR